MNPFALHRRLRSRRVSQSGRSLQRGDEHLDFAAVDEAQPWPIRHHVRRQRHRLRRRGEQRPRRNRERRKVRL